MRKPKRLPADELAPYLWAFPSEYRGRWSEPAQTVEHPRIDWAMLYGNTNPVEIEVGFGKGLYLVTAGTQNPGINYFGIEIIRKYQMYAANRITARKLANVKTCCGDAKFLLRDFVVPGSVNQVHVFFPDPWWKNRHKKRTLMSEEFANLVLTTLRPGGRLHFVTDVADYFAMVTELLATVTAFELLPPPAEPEPQHDMDYLTNFERKFRQEGRPIYRSLYEKRSS
ncbi:tRNA (guanosine(46)-N7)-methyltransferase TrmB [soil metagenome]